MKSEYVEISDELFLKVGKLITERYGIKMPIEKKIMFQARLQKRLRQLEMTSFDQYIAALYQGTGLTDEFELLSDYISTNKTEFFREKAHFQFLNDVLLPSAINERILNAVDKFEIWSAGCSSGQEAYSLAIQIEEFMRKSRLRFAYSVTATDISRRMLKQAREAVYPMNQALDISLDIKQRYLLKSKNTLEQKIKVTKEIRDKISVGYLNLMDNRYPFPNRFNAVFLRNTLIYFEHRVQVQVLEKVLECLKPGGYLFIGHSESLINLHLPIRSIAPSIYIKQTVSENDTE